ncbi:MAG: bifunctional trypsin-like peptidase domain-containing/SEL1-like repeat protein, partial [Bdellovibrionales bacterium]
FLNFYFVLQIFAISMGLLCGSFSYSEKDIAQENIPSDVEEVKNSVVMLHIKGYRGTGFILEDGLLVTNVHVVESILNKNNFFSKINFKSLSHIEISQEGQFLDIQVTSIQALDPVHDLALLNIKGSEIPPPIKKARGEVDFTKDKLFLVGYPNRKLKTIGQKGPIKMFESEARMPISTNDTYGASGSPIVNQKGEIMGVSHSASGNNSIFSYSDSLFSLQNAEYGVQCSKSTSIKNCFQQMEDFHIKEALKGDTYAQYTLGLYFIEEYFNHKEGMKWLERADQKGFVLAQSEIGYKFFIYKKYKKALKWLEQAAKKGDAHLMYQLGVIYYEGEVAPQDFKKAIEYFKKATQAGNKEAQNFLKKLKNNKKCIKIFNKGDQ